MKSKLKKELLIGLSAIVIVIVVTIFSVQKIYQREDLALLQLNFINTVLKAKLCFDENGVVQDASQGREGQVFICSRQDVVKDTFPILNSLSKRGIKYKYLSSQKCFARKCDKEGEETNKGGRINIGRGNKLVLSCNVAEGICRTK